MSESCLQNGEFSVDCMQLSAVCLVQCGN